MYCKPFFLIFIYCLATALSRSIEEARCQFLLAQIYQKTKESDETLEAYLKAKELQSKYDQIFFAHKIDHSLLASA